MICKERTTKDFSQRSIARRVLAQEGIGRTKIRSGNGARPAIPTLEIGPPAREQRSWEFSDGLLTPRAQRVWSGVQIDSIVESLDATPVPFPLVRMDSLMHELEMIHSTLATLKDLSAQQRDRLRDAQELLAVRARQGTVELEVTQEMLGNERAFLERVHEVISQAQRSPEKPEEPPPLPPRS